MGLVPYATIEWLGQVPTTNLRICVTLVVFLGTAVRYLTSQTWAPSLEWVGFLVAMSGVDSLTFIGKRKTQHVAPKETD